MEFSGHRRWVWGQKKTLKVNLDHVTSIQIREGTEDEKPWEWIVAAWLIGMPKPIPIYGFHTKEDAQEWVDKEMSR